jgi:riboflavin transporter FmnP
MHKKSNCHRSVYDKVFSNFCSNILKNIIIYYLNYFVIIPFIHNIYLVYLNKDHNNLDMDFQNRFRNKFKQKTYKLETKQNDKIKVIEIL